MYGRTVIPTSILLAALLLLNGCTVILTSSVAITNSANKPLPVAPESYPELSIGDPIEVHLDNGTLIRGSLLTIDEEVISIDYQGEIISVQPSKILSLSQAPKRNKIWPAVVVGGIIDTIVVVSLSQMKLGLHLNF